jgi:hypothetical protein
MANFFSILNQAKKAKDWAQVKLLEELRKQKSAVMEKLSNGIQEKLQKEFGIAFDCDSKYEKEIDSIVIKLKPKI